MKSVKLAASIGLFFAIVLLGITTSTQASPPATQPDLVLGAPGTSYRYVQTFGITNTAYTEDTTYINYPLTLYTDASNNVYVSDTGYRVLGFIFYV